MNIIDKYKKMALKSQGISADEALDLFVEGSNRPYNVMAAASEIREHFKGREIILCGIVNAKSGKCSEDCAFCAQSSHHAVDIATYPLKPAGQMIDEAQEGPSRRRGNVRHRDEREKNQNKKRMVGDL